MPKKFKMQIFKFKSVVVVIQKYSVFPTFFFKMAKFDSRFFLKYDFLINYQWFTQPKRFCHKILLKIWKFTSEVKPISIFVKNKEDPVQSLKNVRQKALNQNFCAHMVCARKLLQIRVVMMF